MMTERTCILCWTPGMLAIRLDKRGRPYGHCRSCYGRIFFQDSRALTGLALLPDQVDGLLSAMRERPELVQQAERTVLRLREQLRAAVLGPVEGMQSSVAAPTEDLRDRRTA